MTMNESAGHTQDGVAAEVPVVIKRNPFLRVRFDDGIYCDLLLTGSTSRVPDGRYIAALAELDGPVATDEGIERVAHSVCDSRIDEAVDIVAYLLHAGMITDAAVEWEEMPAVQHWVDRGWLDALIFHLRCGVIDFDDDNVQATEQEQDALLGPIVADGVPDPWKHYDSRPTVALPEGRSMADLPPLEDILLRRRSNRPWRRDQINLTDLATIVDLATSELIKARQAVQREVTERPSALLHSAFSALEIYVVAHAVEGLPPGLHHIATDSRTLEQVRAGDLRDEMIKMCVGQHRAGSGSASFVITGMWQRYMFRYRYPHAYRTLLINAAELAQKIILAATGVGLSTFITPAFDDQFADDFLDIDPLVETPIEVIGVG